jgi:hypothetical protein
MYPKGKIRRIIETPIPGAGLFSTEAKLITFLISACPG